MPVFTGAEVGRHNGPKSTWMVIANEVYDVTKFLNSVSGFNHHLFYSLYSIFVDSNAFRGQL